MYQDAHRCNRGSAAYLPSRRWRWTLIRSKACTANITTAAARHPLVGARQKEADVAVIKFTFKRNTQKLKANRQARFNAMQFVGWVSDSVTQHFPLRRIGSLSAASLPASLLVGVFNSPQPKGGKNSTTNSFFHGEMTGLPGLPQ